MFQPFWSPRASHRSRIVALVLASGLPVLVLAIFGLWRYLDAAKQEVVDDRVATVQGAALTTQAFVSDVTASAETLGLSAEATDPAQRDALSARLERVRLANPDWEQVAVLDSSGHMIASTGSLPADASLIRALADRVQETGRANVAAIDAPDGTMSRLLVGVSLNFTDDTRGMLVVVPSLSTLAAELRSQARGSQLEAALMGPDRAILISPSAKPAWLSSQMVIDGVLTRRVGTEQVSSDGVGLLVAYAPVEGFDLTVLVAQPTTIAFAALERQVGVAALALVVAVGLAGLLAWAVGGRLSLYYQRVVEARDQAERAGQSRDAVLASVSHDLQSPLDRCFAGPSAGGGRNHPG
jgi:hypothetical protein